MCRVRDLLPDPEFRVGSGVANSIVAACRSVERISFLHPRDEAMGTFCWLWFIVGS